MGKSKTEKMKDKRDKLIAKGKKIAHKIGKRDGIRTAVVLLSACVLAGCATSDPASRVTHAQYGDITIRLDNCASNTVCLTIGDGAYASADSKGSTETQTATPTLDIRPTTTVNYGLTSTSASGTDWIAQLTSASAQGLASWIKSDNTAATTMTVTKTDGSTEKVTCSNGKCTTASGATVTCDGCTKQ